MEKKIYIISILTFLFLNGVIYGQCPAPEKMQRVGSKLKGDYGVSNQSRSGSLISGQSYDMTFIAQSSYDYRISSGTFDSDKGIVRFEVYEMVNEKDADGNYVKVRSVIVSSDGVEPVEFTTDKGRKLTISVTYDGGSNKKPQCVCVLIEDKKTTKIGL